MTRVLVSIITGGRPALADRPTRLFVDSMQAAGFTDFEWVIRSDHATAYERDDLPLNVYPVEWATRYARSHWRHPVAVHEPGGFFGAFPGREWAMRTAEDRGYDAVLQMDDNVKDIGLLNPHLPGMRTAVDPGTLLHLLTEICLSTTCRMTGAQLSSVPPKGMTAVVRPGYPYSVFVERCGPGRMPYYGPFEDDIMHALEYARHGGPSRTAGVVDVIRYNKEHTNRTGGMRTRYDATRGLEIVNRYPENVRLAVSRKTSSPRDTARGVRHFLNTRGFTPIKVLDRPRFTAAADALHAGVGTAVSAQHDANQGKIQRRART